MSSLKHFLHSEASGGIALIAASVLALVLANLPLPSVHDILHNDGFHFWINDGLMAVFFFLAGLEIKREMVEGALSTRAKAMLPVIAAIGGMAAPVLIFWFINKDNPDTLAGWAIPAATDIAFAVCVVTLLGNRVPPSLKILLLAIAVIDDIGAILIIALFYGQGFWGLPFAAAVAVTAVMALLNRRNVRSVWPYAILSVMLWYAVMLSGVHATMAGVIAALAMPLSLDLEKKIHPWVAFFVLPLFGFFNAGVSFDGITTATMTNPLTMGIFLGLVVGKPLGIFSVLALAIRSGLSPMPAGARWPQLYGVAVLCGIGFTMSLFIGALAFGGGQEAEIRLGILSGSVVSALAGYLILRYDSAAKRS